MSEEIQDGDTVQFSTIGTPVRISQLEGKRVYVSHFVGKLVYLSPSGESICVMNAEDLPEWVRREAGLPLQRPADEFGVRCPYCHSTNVIKLPDKYTWECRFCGYKFLWGVFRRDEP